MIFGRVSIARYDRNNIIYNGMLVLHTGNCNVFFC